MHSGSRYANEIRTPTQERVRLIGDAADIWRFAESIRAITEDTPKSTRGGPYWN